MKRTFALTLAVLLALSALCLPLSSCSRNQEEDASETGTGTDSATEAVTDARDEFGRLLVPSSLPDDLRFNAETVTVLFRAECTLMNTAVEFKSEGSTGEPINDAVYARNIEVEKQLNVVLDNYIIDGYTHEPYLNAVRKAYQAGDAPFDIMAYYAYYGVSMATEGYLANLLNQTYTDFSKPWWSQDFVNELTLCDQLYFAIGDLSLSATACTNAMFFNKKMLNDVFRDLDLYETVRNGDWTLETYATLIEDCYFDADGDGKRSQNDRYGAMMTSVATPMDAYILSLGCSITEKDEEGIPRIVFGTDHDVEAFDALFNLIIHNEGSLTGVSGSDVELYQMAQEKFARGETLFLIDIFHATDYLRSTGIEYGVLPMFKYDKAQAGYWTGLSDVYSLLSIYSGSQVPEQADAVMELMAQKSYEKVTPAYFDISLKQKYSHSNQDAQMFDLVLSGRRFNFGFVYSGELGDPTHLWRIIISNQQNTFASSRKSQNRSYSAALDRLVKKYKNMAKNN